MRISLALGLASLFTSLLISTPSWARVPTRLVYVRSQSTSVCPEQPALEAAVAARLGYEPFSPWGDQTIVATISRNNEQFVARAELVDHDGIVQGSREVHASLSDCAELIATLALAISITLDPMHVASAPPAAENSPGPVEDATAPDNPRSVAAEPEVARGAEPETPRIQSVHPVAAATSPVSGEGSSLERAVELRAYAGAIGTFEAAPHPALGARAGVSLRSAPFSLGLEGWATLPSSEAAVGGREVRISLLSSAVSLCLDVAAPLSVCALTSLGRLRGAGRHVAEPKSESRFYAAVGARGLLTIPLRGGFALVGNLDLTTILTRPSFQLSNEDVWRPGPVAVAAGLGVSLRFF